MFSVYRYALFYMKNLYCETVPLRQNRQDFSRISKPLTQLEYDAGGSTAEGQADGDDCSAALLTLLLLAARALLPRIGGAKVATLLTGLTGSSGLGPSHLCPGLLTEQITCTDTGYK